MFTVSLVEDLSTYNEKMLGKKISNPLSLIKAIQFLDKS